jgi:hypothetical protein
MSDLPVGAIDQCKLPSCRAPFKKKRLAHEYCKPAHRTKYWQEQHISIQIPNTPEALSELGRRVLEGMEGLRKPKVTA